MTDIEFATILQDETKAIDGDILWTEDEDHSPAVEFRAEVASESGSLFIKGSYNELARTVSFALIHRGTGRIYALDLGKDHHNPSCQNVGEKHKHTWKDGLGVKEAYVPSDITHPVTNPTGIWAQFCAEAKITHRGKMHQPPPPQLDLLL